MGQSSSSCAPEPGGEPGSSGGGGLPGDESCVDLEVSSNSSGETLEAGAPPEGLDITWAQAPQTWHLARWCVARVHSVCRAMAKILAASDIRIDKECQKYAGKLHVKRRGFGKGAGHLPTAQVRESATAKAKGVLEALRERAESMDVKAERTLSSLAVCDAPRAQALYQLGLRVQDPTISEKSFRRVLADLGLAKAPCDTEQTPNPSPAH